MHSIVMGRQHTNLEHHTACILSTGVEGCSIKAGMQSTQSRQACGIARLPAGAGCDL